MHSEYGWLSIFYFSKNQKQDITSERKQNIVISACAGLWDESSCRDAYFIFTYLELIEKWRLIALVLINS